MINMKLLNTYKNNKFIKRPIYISPESKPYLTQYFIYSQTAKKLMYSFMSNDALLLRISLPEYNLVKITKQDSI